MNDMSGVIIPKSDQLNADTLLAGPQTFKIRDVEIRGGQEQPVSIYFDGTDLAFRPCKSMSRVLVSAWGPDASVYAGRSLTLYRDASVKWGGMEVGGIRISHMSHIDSKMMLQLTATKGQRKPHTVMPLVMNNERTPDASKAQAWTATQIAAIEAATTLDELTAIHLKAFKPLGKLAVEHPDLWTKIDDAYRTAQVDLEPPGRAVADMGERDDPPADF